MSILEFYEALTRISEGAAFPVGPGMVGVIIYNQINIKAIFLLGWFRVDMGEKDRTTTCSQTWRLDY